MQTPAETLGVERCEEGRGCTAAETPASAAQAGVPPAPGGGISVEVIRVEVIRVEKRWNIPTEDIAGKIASMLKSYGNDQVTLFYHSTWGSCRVTKFIVMSTDGSYIPDGEWIDNSSNKNANKWKIMPLDEFMEKYAGKELLAYLYVSPSCNKSKRFSFRAVFRVVRAG
jgi:hypothetical protein